MRLASLKIAGFKSFADPVNLHFPDALTAIVGPNGCGKSNVMDAIRWVMGESSARQLRGEAMSDVIFAGAGSRAPLGQASVELVFENTQGRLGGEYNAYTELSVRRLVTREGGSHYFLNGRRCRRRDIQDIFLGTGLGPRSYAVIQQGMINRIVEARPEELRVFMEEAAGVSRYQSRRHETLQHLEHARQNLARLDDLRSEQDSQLRQLRRQSQAAERYRQLQAEQQQLQAECWSAQWQQLQQQMDQHLATLQQQGEVLVSLHEQRQHTRTALEQASTTLEQLLQAAEPAQQAWQQLEQQALSAELQAGQLARQLQALEQQQQQLSQQQAQQQLEQQQLQHSLALLNQQIAAAEAQQQAQPADLPSPQQHQQQRQQLEAEREHLQQQGHELARLQQAQQASARQLEQLQRSRERLVQQQQALQQQQHSLRQGSDAGQLEADRAEQQHLAQQLQQLEQQLARQQADEQQHLAQKQHAQEQVSHTRQQQRAVQLEQQALRQLMQQQQPWPADCLGHRLQLKASAPTGLAAWIDRIYAQWLRLLPTPDAGLQGYRAERAMVPVHWPDGVQPLAQWVEQPVLSLWQQVGVCSTPVPVAQLQAWCQQLPVGVSLLYLPGHSADAGQWLGPDWQRGLDEVATGTDPALPLGGLSQRLQLEALAAREQHWATQHQQAVQQLAGTEQQLQQCISSKKTLHQQHKQLEQQHQQLAVQLSRLEAQLQLRAQQAAQVGDQLALLDEQHQDLLLEQDELQLGVAGLALRVQRLQQTHSSQQQQFEPRWQAWQQQDDALRQHLQQQQALHQTLIQAHSRRDWSLQDLQRLHTGLQQSQQQLDQLVQQQRQTLQQHHTQQQQAGQARTQADLARQRLDQQQQQLESTRQQLEALRQQQEQQTQHEQQHREHMAQVKLAWQADLTRQEQVEAQLQAAGLVRLTGLMPDQGEREQRLAQLNQQLARMGELNLAAPAALAELEQRMAELQLQQSDIQASIDQLERAIAEIDQETRALFMHTFDQVNAGLQRLFPQVFNGGEASLSLEDGWQSGVRLMARPPGKRNSTLALLSGGEKALTALALIFAIFKLNPAPFCLLDEVDAPLDDANVQRFCQLVTELSREVQFLYISHNKLAMRMAQQLIGVTMPDPGLSRTVRVNLEQAAHWGAA